MRPLSRLAETLSWYEDNSIADCAERSKSQRLFTNEESAEFEKIGYTNLHDWCCHNWGTKWNACESNIECEYDGYVEIRFVTAWSPPRPIFEALQKKFPHSLYPLSRYSEEWQPNDTHLLRVGNPQMTDHPYQSPQLKLGEPGEVEWFVIIRAVPASHRRRKQGRMLLIQSPVWAIGDGTHDG